MSCLGRHQRSLPYHRSRRLWRLKNTSRPTRMCQAWHIGKSEILADAVRSKKRRKAVYDMVHSLMAAFIADYGVVGGGNAKLLKALPPCARLGHNHTASRGGYRVWGVDSCSSEDLELFGQKNTMICVRWCVEEHCCICYGYLISFNLRTPSSFH